MFYSMNQPQFSTVYTRSQNYCMKNFQNKSRTTSQWRVDLPLSCVSLASKGVGDEEKRGKMAFFSHPLTFCVFNADYFCLKALKIVDVFSVLYIVEVTSCEMSQKNLCKRQGKLNCRHHHCISFILGTLQSCSQQLLIQNYCDVYNVLIAWQLFKTIALIKSEVVK